jgi:hypothetical protein
LISLAVLKTTPIFSPINAIDNVTTYCFA